jgi:hypothetical protein
MIGNHDLGSFSERGDLRAEQLGCAQQAGDEHRMLPVVPVRLAHFAAPIAPNLPQALRQNPAIRPLPLEIQRIVCQLKRIMSAGIAFFDPFHRCACCLAAFRQSTSLRSDRRP